MDMDQITADFGWMRGQNGADIRIIEKPLQFLWPDPACLGIPKSTCNGAFAWRRTGHLMAARPANMVLIFGQIGEMGKVTEGAHDLDGLLR